MEWSILIVTLAFLSIVQVAIPFLMKRTVVFGVNVPLEHSTNDVIRKYKKMYAGITGIVSLGGLMFFVYALAFTNASESNLVLAWLMILFAIIMISLSVYFVFHSKVSGLKKEQKWFQDKKQIKVSDLTVRTQDEMLSWFVYLIPMILTFGLIIFTFMQYDKFPNQIPTHWGPNGQPDAFAAKSFGSVFSLPLMLLTLQTMFLGINELTKKSGIKIRSTNMKASRIRQLRLRKYTSWLLLVMSVLITILFSFLQFTTLYADMVNDLFIMLVPLAFLFVTLMGTVLYAIKVGKVDSDLDKEIIFDKEDDVVGADEDQYWKGGLIYVNKNDPSIFVEKRFGVGMTINFAHPIAYLVLFGPIVVILVLSFI